MTSSTLDLRWWKITSLHLTESLHLFFMFLFSKQFIQIKGVMIFCPQPPPWESWPNRKVYIYSLFEHLRVGRKFPSDLSVHSFSESDCFSVNSLMWLHLTEVILIFSPFSSEPKFNISVCVCVGWFDRLSCSWGLIMVTVSGARS